MPISDTEYFRYLPVSDYDKQWGVYVTGVGCTSVPPFSKSYPVSRAEIVVREAKTLLEQHAAKIVNMDQLAAQFQLSEKHFRRVFKEHTGLSPYQYYLQIRIHRAKEMLLGTTLSIKEIAASLHFKTPFHFSSVFKKKTGMSPSRWRSGCD